MPPLKQIAAPKLLGGSAPRERGLVMAARWDGQALREPISAEQPCGQNLDDTSVLSAFDSLRLFGQTRSPEAPPDADEGDKGLAKARPALEWDRIRADALDGLTKSKDLRLLAYLGTSVLRTDGLPAFALVLSTASHWLEAYWPDVYPLLDEDAIARRNALNCLADPMAVVDRLWRLPLVDSRQHGRISLRDIDIARGQASAGPTEEKADPAALRDAFAAIALEDLIALERCVADGDGGAEQHRRAHARRGRPEVAPDFATLSTHFAKLAKLLPRRVGARRSGGSAAGAGAAEGDGMETSRFTGGALKSRQDAVRALDAVADYFRRNEPSSPIPLFDRSGQAPGRKGLSRGARRHCSRRRSGGAVGRRAERSVTRHVSYPGGNAVAKAKQSEVHRAQPGAARADRVRRRALRRREEDSAAVRDGRARRSVGQAGRAAGAGRRPQVPRDRRRQLRQPHEGAEAARRVPGARTR